MTKPGEKGELGYGGGRGKREEEEEVEEEMDKRGGGTYVQGKDDETGVVGSAEHNLHFHFCH